MNEIYSRTAMLIGEEYIEILKNRKVIVFGVGGVGSFAVEALSRCGIGSITLVDNDVVCKSNINRQLIALNSTIDKFKTEVMKDRIQDINPDITVKIINKFCLPENTASFFEGESYDYIIDAIDTVSAKIALAEFAQNNNMKIISAMGAGNKLHPELFEVADIYKTSVCPLCRVMRRELKNRNIKSLKVVYSKEEPKTAAINSDNNEKKRVSGSISFVPSVMGLILAGEVIRDLTGIN